MNRLNPPLRILAIALVFSLCLPLIAFAGKSEVIKKTEMEIPVKSLKSIDVETVNGSIMVSESKRNKIELIAEISVKGPKEEICEELVEEVELKIDEKGETLNIEAKFPKKFRYSFSVSYEIAVPKEFKADCESVNGNIQIFGLTGGVDVETVNGSIECKQTSGDIYTETVNGYIELNKVTGNTVASAVNGSIDISFAKNAPQKVEVDAVNGQIDINLDSKPNAVLTAETMNGAITIGDQEVKKSSIMGKSFQTQLGDGKGKWSLETVNGSISVSFPD